MVFPHLLVYLSPLGALVSVGLYPLKRHSDIDMPLREGACYAGLKTHEHSYVLDVRFFGPRPAGSEYIYNNEKGIYKSSKTIHS